MKSKSVQLPVTPELTDALREVLPCGGDDAPSSVTGWPAPGRHWRKIVAEYPNGWNLTVHFTKLGKVSSAKAALRLVARKAAA